jgi:hypothetical protein
MLFAREKGGEEPRASAARGSRCPRFGADARLRFRVPDDPGAVRGGSYQRARPRGRRRQRRQDARRALRRALAASGCAPSSPATVRAGRGAWRSLVSALVWGTRGPEFESRRPDRRKPRGCEAFLFSNTNCARMNESRRIPGWPPLTPSRVPSTRCSPLRQRWRMPIGYEPGPPDCCLDLPCARVSAPRLKLAAYGHAATNRRDRTQRSEASPRSRRRRAASSRRRRGPRCSHPAWSRG